MWMFFSAFLETNVQKLHRKILLSHRICNISQRESYSVWIENVFKLSLTSNFFAAILTSALACGWTLGQRSEKSSRTVPKISTLCNKNVVFMSIIFYAKCNFYSCEKWNMTYWLDVWFSFSCASKLNLTFHVFLQQIFSSWLNQRCLCQLHSCVTLEPCKSSLMFVAGLARTGFCLINSLTYRRDKVFLAARGSNTKLSKAEACCRPNTRSYVNSFVKLTESCKH